MPRRGRKIGCLSKHAVWLCFVIFVFSLPLKAQQIIPDGNTNTVVSGSNTTTNITTTTIKGTNAFNSFEKFNVNTGNTVNLVVPGSTENLINLVHSEKSQINGVLNSLKNNKVGGNVFIVNPYGVTVGSQGSINVGSLTTVTPTTDYMDNFFDAPGIPNDSSVNSLLNGSSPVNPDGIIEINGSINAIENVKLDAGNIINNGQISTGQTARDNIELNDVVNIEETYNASEITEHNGEIVLQARKDIVQNGTVISDGTYNLDAGNISLTAKNNITVESESLISAKGEGENSNAGDIYIFADNNAEFNKGAVIDARGGDVSGDGGFIEFSAKNKVTIDGGIFRANTNDGEKGEIFIDPLVVNTGDFFTDGTNALIEAFDEIIVSPGAIVSSRNLVTGATGEDVTGSDHMNDLSQGDSGNIYFDSPIVSIGEGAEILAFANNGYNSGDIDISYNVTYTNNDVNIDPYAFIAGDNININPASKLNIQGGEIYAENNLTVEGGAIATQDFTFKPQRIDAFSITSTTFLMTGPNITINSSGNVEFGNLDQILENGSPLSKTDIDLTSTTQSVKLSGDCSVSGSVMLTSTTADASIDAESNIFAGGNITLTAYNGTGKIGTNSVINANNSFYMNTDIVSVESGAIVVSGIDIDLAPETGGKLDIKGGSFWANSQIFINAESFATRGVTFTPERIAANTLLSDFLTQNGSINIATTDAEIRLGNIDFIYIANAPLNPTTITLSSGNADTYLQGSITASSDIDVDARDIIIQPETYLFGNNVSLDYNGGAGDNFSLLGGHINASNILTLNGDGGSSIEDKTIKFLPESINALTLSSDFFAENTPFQILGNDSVEIGNLDNIVISNNDLNPTSITLSSPTYVSISGDNSTTGNLSLSAPDVNVLENSRLMASNITLNPTARLNVSGILSTPGTLTVNSGNINANGISFTPEKISTVSLVSDFLTQDAPLTITSTSDIAIGNLDNVYINLLPLNPTSISLNSTGGKISLSGDISTSGNITIAPTTSLEVTKANLITPGTLILNGGDILNNGVIFRPESISAGTFVSDFLADASDLIINSNATVSLSNLDNVMISAATIALNNIDISAQKIELSGTIKTTGDFLINPVDSLVVENATLEATNNLIINGGNIEKYGITFKPDSIITGGLTSDFMSQSGPIDISSDSNISIGNLDSIQIGAGFLDPTNITLYSGSSSSVELSGSINATNTIDLSGGYVRVLDGATINATDINLQPVRKLDFGLADMDGSNSLIVNGGFWPGCGIKFNPNDLSSGTLTSDFFSNPGPINMMSVSDIYIGNTNNVREGVLSIVVQGLQLTSKAGSVTAYGDIDITGLNNLELDSYGRLVVENANFNIPFGQLWTFARDRLRHGITFNVQNITAQGSTSDFLAPNSDNTFISNKSITIGNLDGLDLGGPLNAANIDFISYYDDVNLYGTSTASGNITITAGKKLTVDQASLDAGGFMTIAVSNIANWGLHFDPDLIDANTLTSTFLTFSGPINIFSLKDITFGNTDNITQNNGATLLNPTSITLDARNRLTVTRDLYGNGFFDIHSVFGDINIGNVIDDAGNNVSIWAEAGKVKDLDGNNFNKVECNNLSIEALGVGIPTDPFDIDITGNLSVYATDDIYIVENGTMNASDIESYTGLIDLSTNGVLRDIIVGTITTPWEVYLTANRDIIDGPNNAATNVTAYNLYASGDNIGTAVNPFDVDLTDNLDVTANVEIAIIETSGDMNVSSVSVAGGGPISLEASGNINVYNINNPFLGNTTLTASGNIIDANGDPAADISSNELTMIAQSIGESGNDLEIDLLAVTGMLTTTTTNDQHITEEVGNIRVNLLDAGGGNIFLTATGDIVDNIADNNVDIDCADATLTANNGIGTNINPIELNLTGLLTATADSGIYLTQNSGDLNVLNVTSGTGSVDIETLNGTLNIGLINSLAGSTTLTTTAGDILDLNGDGLSNINCINLDLISGNGIGTSANPFDFDTTGAFNASAGTDMYVIETAGGIQVDFVSATGIVELTAAGGTVNDFNNNIFSNIDADSLSITAQGIGTGLNPFDIDTTTELTSVIATNNNIVIREILGDLNVVYAESTNGNISLTTPAGAGRIYTGIINSFGDTNLSSNSGIVDLYGDANTNIYATNLTLDATGIGTALDPVEIEITGNLIADTTLGLGDICLEQMSGDLNIDLVQTSVSGDVYINSSGAILDAINNSSANINTRNATMFVDSIGTAGNFLDLSLTGVLQVQSTSDVFLRETTGNVRVNTVVSTGGDVSLTTGGAVGNIFDNNNDDNPNIIANNIFLNCINAGGPLNNLDVDLNGGILTLDASDNSFVREFNGDLDVNANASANSPNFNFDSDNGNINVWQINTPGDTILTALSGGVTDANNDPATDISCNNLDITSNSIGTGVNELDIDLVGSLKTTTNGDQFIIETVGDLNIDNIDAGIAGNATLSSASGNIVDFNNDLNENIFANDLSLNSFGGIGSNLNRLEIGITGNLTSLSPNDTYLTQIGNDLNVLNVQSTGGSVDLQNDNNNINVGIINSFNDTILLSNNGQVIDLNNDALTNIFTNNLNITSLAIGSFANPLEVEVSNNLIVTANNDIFVTRNNGNLTALNVASTTGLVNLDVANGNLNVGVITTPGSVQLSALLGNVLDLNNDTNNNVIGDNLTIDALSIGTAGNPFEFDLTNSITANTDNDQYLVENDGDLNINTVNSASGFVSLRSVNGGIVDFNNDLLPNVTTNDLILDGNFAGSIVNPFEFEITGNLNSTTTNDIIARQIDGDLNALSITSGSSNVDLSTSNGSINVGLINSFNNTTLNTTNGNINDLNNDGNANVIASNLSINTFDLGTIANPFEIDLINNFSAVANNDIYVVENTGPLNVLNAQSAGGVIDLSSIDNNINVFNINTPANVLLNALNGSIIDSNNDANPEIFANNLNISANSAGSAGNPLEANLTGSISGTITNDMSYAETAADLNVGILLSTNGELNLTSTNANINIDILSAFASVFLNAPNGIVGDLNGDGNTNIFANDLNITSSGIGQVANPLDVEISNNLTANVNNDIYLSQTLGNLNVLNVLSGTGGVNLDAVNGNMNVGIISTSGNVQLSAGAGGVTDLNNDANNNVICDNLTINSMSIGTPANPLEFDLINSLTTNTNNDQYLVETNGNIQINTINSAAGPVSLTSNTGGIVDFNNDLLPNVITNNLILNGSFAGSIANPFEFELTGGLTSTTTNDIVATQTNGDLNALNVVSTGNNVNLLSSNGNLNVGLINSLNNTTLTANNGNVTDMNNDANSNVFASNLTINSLAIGTAGNPLEIDLLNSFTATTDNNMYIVENNGPFNVSNAQSLGGVIDLTSINNNINISNINTTSNTFLSTLSGSIVDANNDASPDIFANDLIINANSVGTAGNPLEASLTGIVYGTITNNMFYSETAGDLNTGLLQSTNGELNLMSANANINIDIISAFTNINLNTPNGFVVDLNSDANANIFAVNLLINGQGAGTNLNFLETDLTGIFNSNVTNDLFINENTGDFNAGTILSTLGSVNLSTTNGNIMVNSITTPVNNTTLTANTGNIIDSNNDANTNILADSLNLNAQNAGSNLNYFDVESPGLLTLQINNDVYIVGTNGPLNINNINPLAGNASISTLNDSINFSNTSLTANTITLNSANDILVDNSNIASSQNMDVTGNNINLNNGQMQTTGVGGATQETLIVNPDDSIDASSTITANVAGGFVNVNNTTSGNNGFDLNITGNVIGTGTLSTSGGPGEIVITNNSANNLNLPSLSIINGTPGSLMINGSAVTSDFGGIVVSIGDTSGTGTININSPNGNVNIGVINTPGPIQITANTGNINDMNNDAVTNIFASNFDIDSTGLGSNLNPFEVELTGSFNAQVVNNLYLTENANNINLGTVQSTNGIIDLNSLNGSINISSTTLSTLNNIILNAINGSVTDSSDDINTNIYANNLTINALSVGSTLNPLEVDLTAALNSNIANDIYLTETSGNLIVDTIQSTSGIINLTSLTGNINISSNTLSTTNDVILSATSGTVIDSNNDLNTNIFAKSLNINASSVGTPANPIEVELTGIINTNTANGLFITENSGDLNLNTINAGAGNVSLNSVNGNINISSTTLSTTNNVTLIANNGSINDSSNDINTNIYANNLNLNALSVGNPLNPLEIDLTGNINANVVNECYINETNGNLNVATINSSNGIIRLISTNGNINISSSTLATPDNVYLTAVSGAIIDSSNDTNTNIFANDLYINALSIGNNSNPVEIDLTGLLTISTGGNTIITENNGDMNIATIQSASGNIYLTSTNGNINITSNTISTPANVFLTAPTGMILDTSNNANTNITAFDLFVNALGLGEPLNPIESDLTNLFSAQVTNDLYLDENTGDLNINNVQSNSGNVFLTSKTGNVSINELIAYNDASIISQAGSIYDADELDDSTINITTGGNLYLESNFGNDQLGIGSYNSSQLTNDLDVDIDGTLTAQANNGSSVFINQHNRDLLVNTINTNATTDSDVHLASEGGIYGIPGPTNITAYSLVLNANGEIGTPTDYLTIQSNNTSGLSAEITTNNNNVYLRQVTGDANYTFDGGTGIITFISLNGTIAEYNPTSQTTTPTTTTTTTTPTTTTSTTTDVVELNNNNQDIVIINESTGETTSLINNQETDNVIQIDFSDTNTSDSTNIDIQESSLIASDSSTSDFNSSDFSTENDDITFTIEDNSFSEDSNTSDTTSIIDTNDSNSTENTELSSNDNSDISTDSDSNDNDSSDNNNNTSATVRVSLKDAVSNDEPINIKDQNIMKSVFNICQKKDACEDLLTPENNQLLDQTINLPEKNELAADSNGVDFASHTGYHPAGLEGFLITLNIIEKNVKNNPDNPQKYSLFSYRHPDTKLRISNIENHIEVNKLKRLKNKKVNRKAYKLIVKEIQ